MITGCTHGTLLKNKLSIEKNGFNLSDNGRLGDGVYFWSGMICGEELAMAWVAQSNEVKKIKDNNGLIVICDIDCTNEEVFDIESEECKSALLKITRSSGISDPSSIHNMFIDLTEKKKGLIVKVVKGKVSPPKFKFFKESKYPGEVLGSPFCYSVRDRSVIIIRNYKEFNV